jgi:hypothetical protein
MLVSVSIVARLFITLSDDSRSRPGGWQECFIAGGLLMIITLFFNKALLKSISMNFQTLGQNGASLSCVI